MKLRLTSTSLSGRRLACLWTIWMLLSCAISNFYAQDTLTFAHCIELAKNYQLPINLESNAISKIKTVQQFQKFELLPTISAGIGINSNFGRRVDPFTNTFATSNVNSQSFGLSSSLPIFNGFTYFNNKNRIQLQLKTADISLEEKQNERQIEVLNAYIKLCKLQLQLDFSNKRIVSYEEIQRIQLNLIRAGRITSVDTIRSNTAIYTEKVFQLNLVNSFKIKTIDLNFLLGLSLLSAHFYQIETVTNQEFSPKFQEEFLQQKLELEEVELRINLKTSNASNLPSLSLNANLGTGFSTNNKDYSKPDQPLFPYDYQINSNFYQGIGFYLNIPLFGKGSYFKAKKLNEISNAELESKKELNKISLEKRKLENDQNRVNLRANIVIQESIARNLETIYNQTKLLYTEGKIIYREVEISFQDWQSKLVEIEGIKLDVLRLGLQ